MDSWCVIVRIPNMPFVPTRKKETPLQIPRGSSQAATDRLSVWLKRDVGAEKDTGETLLESENYVMMQFVGELLFICLLLNVIYIHLFNLQVLQLRLWYPCVCRFCADLCWSVAQIYMWCLILAGWLMGTNACLLACLSKLMWMRNQMPPYIQSYTRVYFLEPNLG